MLSSLLLVAPAAAAYALAPPLLLLSRARACDKWAAGAQWPTGNASCSNWGKLTGAPLLIGVDPATGVAAKFGGATDVIQGLAEYGFGPVLTVAPVASGTAVISPGSSLPGGPLKLIAVPAGNGPATPLPGDGFSNMIGTSWSVSVVLGNATNRTLLTWQQAGRTPSGGRAELLYATTGLTSPAFSGTTTTTLLENSSPMAKLGPTKAVDGASSRVYSQRPSKGQGIPASDLLVFDLKTSADSQLPSSGVEYMCMHYDAPSKRLGAVIAAAPDAGRNTGGVAAGLTLVEIDVGTGATSKRLQLPPLPPGLTILRGGIVDARFSSSSPVSCSFSPTGGFLSLLLVRVDLDAQPTDALQELHLLTVSNARRV